MYAFVWVAAFGVHREIIKEVSISSWLHNTCQQLLYYETFNNLLIFSSCVQLWYNCLRPWSLTANIWSGKHSIWQFYWVFRTVIFWMLPVMKWCKYCTVSIIDCHYCCYYYHYYHQYSQLCCGLWLAGRVKVSPFHSSCMDFIVIREELSVRWTWSKHKWRQHQTFLSTNLNSKCCLNQIINIY